MHRMYQEGQSLVAKQGGKGTCYPASSPHDFG